MFLSVEHTFSTALYTTPKNVILPGLHGYILTLIFKCEILFPAVFKPNKLLYPSRNKTHLLFSYLYCQSFSSHPKDNECLFLNVSSLIRLTLKKLSQLL